MMNDLRAGATAGAAGTMALDAVSYLDMVMRGRPSSEVPAKMAQIFAEKAGLAQPPGDGQKPSAQTKNRLTAGGALMGYGVGLGIGTIYGLLRPHVRNIPWPIMGIVVGCAAMAASDVPAVQLQLTKPNEWGTAGWLGDIIPHLAYGIITAGVFESIV